MGITIGLGASQATLDYLKSRSPLQAATDQLADAMVNISWILQDGQLIKPRLNESLKQLTKTKTYLYSLKPQHSSLQSHPVPKSLNIHGDVGKDSFFSDKKHLLIGGGVVAAAVGGYFLFRGKRR